MVTAERGPDEAIGATKQLLDEGWDRPIFEATFAHDGVLVRVDLMLPEAGGWQVAEVKASTGVKFYHLSDLATQLWVMLANRVPVSSASIRHLNRGFVLGREGG